jgi:hypothetical protein
MTKPPLLLALISFLPALAFAQGAPHVDRIKRGDTTIVRTTGNGLWGAPRTAVEVRRIAGETEDDPFGQVRSVAVLRNGSVAAFDAKGTAGETVDLFDADGKFVKRIGRKGSGPGEFGDVLDLAVAPNGTLLGWDPRNGRINTYAPDGTFRKSYPFGGGLYASDMVHGDASGNLYVRIMTGRPEPDKDWPIAFLRFRPDGTILDTMRAPAFEPKLPSARDPVHAWTLTADGKRVSGSDDRYAFLVHGPASTVLRIERAIPPVPYQAQERRELQARYDYQKAMNGDSYLGKAPVVPEVKPMFHEFTIDVDGRLWVRRSAPGERTAPVPAFASLPPNRPNAKDPIPTVSYREPSVYDVFQLDGTYLGEVRFPSMVTFQGALGDIIWGTTKGTDDQAYLVKLRIPRN